MTTIWCGPARPGARSGRFGARRVGAPHGVGQSVNTIFPRNPPRSRLVYASRKRSKGTVSATRRISSPLAARSASWALIDRLLQLGALRLGLSRDRALDILRGSQLSRGIRRADRATWME
jgi:hypothetical protein